VASELGLRCEESPDAAVHACLDRLRRRRVDLADALGGRSLRVALTVGSPSCNYHITFTRDGHVMSRSGPDFRPHVEIHGAPGAVARFVAGDMTMMEASFDGLVTLHIPTTEAAAFRRLRALVAEEFRAEDRPREVLAKPGGG
jgi:hypothetical protein